MKRFFENLQDDIIKLQTFLQQEGKGLLKKINEIELKENLDNKKEELQKYVKQKMKIIEPSFKNYTEQIYKKAKKAGIDLNKLEKRLKKTTVAAEKKLKKTAKAASSSLKKTTKKAKKKLRKKTKITKSKLATTLKSNLGKKTKKVSKVKKKAQAKKTKSSK
ncbi:MAG: hypothetical protein CMP11_02430 [Zetaproteobacteria bacterium]|nr:hypothetical protein [Pseudobdellovibrionaceae bacterium]|tara:strand:+ start:247 stop:732 length:486 start_codon:yes stop_codon:yes gene_type:complete